MTFWETYFIMQADKFSSCAGHLCFLAGVIALVCGVGHVAWVAEQHNSYNGDKNAKFELRYILPPLLIFVLLSIIYVAIPTTKTLAACYILPAVTNNEKLNKDIEKLYDVGIERIAESLGVEDITEKKGN